MAEGQRTTIPLFPLETPLFPGVILPLNIFEPRYRRLMADLTALPPGSDQRRFGVVAIRQGWEVEKVAPTEALYDVGCTAVLRAVALQSDGGYQAVAVGADRFRLLDVLAGEEPPYLRAEVEWLDDEEAAEEAAGDQDGLVGPDGGAGSPAEAVVSSVARGSLNVLTGNVRELFVRYVAEVNRLQGAEENSDDEPDSTAELLRGVTGDARALSFLVAAAALLTSEDQQALLAESATRRRLAMESRLLRRELTLLRTIGAVPLPLQQFLSPMTPN